MYLFDLDGTLIDSNGIWTDVDRVFLSRRGFAYTQEYRDAMAHMIFPLGAEYTKQYCHLDESVEDIMAEWMDLAADSYAHVALKPGARALLDKLRDAGERLAIFTSSVRAHCETALRTHGLAERFERVVYVADFGITKSTPEAFRLACRTLAVAPEDCILIDDSVASCRAAREAGLRAIGVYDPAFGVDRAALAAASDRMVDSLEELL